MRQTSPQRIHPQATPAVTGAGRNRWRLLAGAYILGTRTSGSLARLVVSAAPGLLEGGFVRLVCRIRGR